jgi:cation transport regulator ChaC
MSAKRLRSRVPSARFITIASLRNYDLRFHKVGRDGTGKCDSYATGNSEDVVWGVVFEINKAEKHVLDEKESLGYGYDEKVVELTTSSGETMTAFTYCAILIDPQLKPFRWYTHHVLTGAEENGLPGEYIEKILQVESITDSDSDRQAKEMAIYIAS